MASHVTTLTSISRDVDTIESTFERAIFAGQKTTIECFASCQCKWRSITYVGSHADQRAENAAWAHRIANGE